jgi:tight adherence protein B
MLTIIIAIFAMVFAAAAAILLRVPDHSRDVQKRLMALESELAPASLAELATDVRKQEIPLSRLQWLDSLLVKVNLRARLHLFLYQAGVKYSLETLALFSIGGWLITTLLLWLRTGSLSGSVAIGFVVLPLPFFWVRRKRSRRLSKIEQQLPESLDMLVSALRVGHSMMTAIGFLGKEMAEPLGAEFRKCFEEQNYGTDLRTAMLNIAGRAPAQDVRMFVAAVLIQKESGGNLAEVLEKVAATNRERFRLKKQIGVHTAQGRATGGILSLLPLILGFLMYLVHPEGISILWKTDVGLKLLYAASGMTVTGGLIIRKIVRIRV